jgi:hypothetical protein
MANSLLTPDIITKQALVEFKNEMVLLDCVDRQLDSMFDKKIGNSVNVRKRVRYLAIDGPDITGVIQDTTEGQVPVTLAFQKTVPIEFTSTDLTLTIEDFSERYVKPAMIELVQQVESEIANQYKKLWWFTGTPGTLPSTYLSIADAEAILDEAGVPMDSNRKAFYTPRAMVTLADGLKSVFPQQIATRAIERSMIGLYAGFDVIKSQSLKSHTVGDYGGTPLINGASQNVTYASVKDTNLQTLITDGWTVSKTGLLLEGDVFTIAGVNSVNPRTRASTGELQTFVVRADANSDGSGNSTISISPAIITSGAYQTVDAAPGDGAAITVKTGTANTQYPQNIFFHKNAITVAFANLVLPESATVKSRQVMDNVSIRLIKEYDILLDEEVTRFDILFGVEAQNPGMGGRHTG